MKISCVLHLCGEVKGGSVKSKNELVKNAVWIITHPIQAMSGNAAYANN